MSQFAGCTSWTSSQQMFLCKQKQNLKKLYNNIINLVILTDITAWLH